MKPYTLEVCVDSVESALAAAQGGGTRLELCANLVIGGTTPSLELFREVQSCTDIDVNVLIRPRFGDFHYTDHELAIMCREVEAFSRAGAHGVVIGCLHRDGSLDLPKMRSLIQAAGESHVTLHRAFDVCNNPFTVLEQAAELGVDTILTSGQEADCWTGRALLAQLLERAPQGMSILIGAGVTPKVIDQMLPLMPARQFHMSGKQVLESEMIYRNPRVSMGLPGISEFQIYRTDAVEIRKAAQLLEQRWGNN
ncbi:MAG: copper homeostasis protein CutC [Candidatus Onthomonas sp.]